MRRRWPFSVTATAIVAAVSTFVPLLTGIRARAERRGDTGCFPQRCFHGGRCVVDDEAGARCVCGHEFLGSRCQFANPCTYKTYCRNNSTCVITQKSLDDLYVDCICPKGLYGERCDQPVCDKWLCHSGTLYISGLRCLCACDRRTHGEHCQFMNYCETDEPCHNGATCVPVENYYKCLCPTSFTGENCHDDVDECLEMQPCQNGGNCINFYGFYKCECRPGFSGINCEEMVYDVSAEFCHNGGTYLLRTYMHACLCPEGFAGAMCETNVDDCVNANCENGGTCVDGVNSYSCICPAQFTGPRCEQDVDECLQNSQLCQNGGTCYNTFGGFECACVATWEGEHCEVNVDDCKSVICTNGGICHDGLGQFECECLPGFTGMLCHLRDLCVTANPCYGDSTCFTEPHFGFAVCSCPAFYTGVNCSEHL